MTATQRLAQHLADLRHAQGWSLDHAAAQSGVSRATLGRIEKGQSSPTTETLGQLCVCYQLSMSRLLAMVEDTFSPRISQAHRPKWRDDHSGFERSGISPPAAGLQGEVVQGHLPAGQHLRYDHPPRQGLEHHLVLLSGQLRVEVDGAVHDLKPGDCLRYVLQGPSAFTTTANSATYMLFLV